MAAPQVLALLGTPSTTSTIGGDAWYYVSQRIERELAFMPPEVADQHILAVYFDKSKKVQRIADYGLKDGKVVDFVSRTTPTAGAEFNFIRNMLEQAHELLSIREKIALFQSEAWLCRFGANVAGDCGGRASVRSGSLQF